jgi:serine/threonine protein kinase
VTQLAPGTTIARRYTIKRQLGRGGMAVVYEAFDPKLSIDVALKVLPPQLATDPAFVARFHREGQALARLSHPNILRIFELQEDEASGLYFLVLEYLGGGTLKARMRPGQPWDVSEVVEVLQPVAAALDYAHRQVPSVIHRDLKPSNIMFARDGRSVVCDFGLARMLAPEPLVGVVDEAHLFTLTGSQPMGTPQYMAPEQAEGHAPGPLSDLYALGTMTYQLLVGRVPYEADTPLATLIQIARDPLPLPTTLNPALEPAVERVLLKALAKSPEHRFATATELIETLATAGELTQVRRESFESRVRGTPPDPEVIVNGRLLEQPVTVPTTQPTDLALKTICSDLVIEGEPAGAEVAVNGVQRGRLPLVISDLAAGQYTISVSAPGFEPSSRQVQLPHISPLWISLQSERFTLDLRGTPPGADLQLDGRRVGALPCTVEDISAGEHELVVSASGYEPITHRITVPVAGPVQLDLRPVLSSLPPRERSRLAAKRIGRLPLGRSVLVSFFVLLVGGLIVRAAAFGVELSPNPSREGNMANGLIVSATTATPTSESTLNPTPRPTDPLTPTGALLANECIDAETRIVDANDALALSDFEAAVRWLTPPSLCPSVDFASRRWVVDRLATAEQYGAGHNWGQLLSITAEVQAGSPEPGFGGWRASLARTLLDAGRTALSEGEWQQAHQMCEEAANIYPEDPAAFRCLAQAQPTATRVPTSVPTTRPTASPSLAPVATATRPATVTPITRATVVPATVAPSDPTRSTVGGTLAYRPLDMQQIANRPLDHLVSPPTGNVTLGGVTFNLRSGERAVFQTSQRFGEQNPTEAEIRTNVSNVLAVRILLVGGYVNPEFRDRKVGEVLLSFSNGETSRADILGWQHIREGWGWDSEMSTKFVMSPPTGGILWENVWVERQSRGGEPAQAFLDMITIPIRNDLRAETLQSITIRDTSAVTVNSIDPSLGVSAITVEFLD